MIVKQLATIARRRKQAEASAAAWAEKTRELILDGHREGIPKAELARASGLTRPTIYSILYRSGAR
jgi:hypothetical protein